MSSSPLIAWDHAWIFSNWRSMTDQKLADHFGTTKSTVRSYRIRNGLNRPNRNAAWDKKWVEANWKSMSDAEMAPRFGVKPDAVAKYRQSQGMRRRQAVKVNWDHEWMLANWKTIDDEDIARKMETSTDTVKAYRLRRGWERPAQRYKGGPKSAKHIQAAIDDALVKGIELCIGRTLVGSRYQMRITATMSIPQGQVLRCEPRLLAGVTALPRMLNEISEEFARMKRRAA